MNNSKEPDKKDITELAKTIAGYISISAKENDSIERIIDGVMKRISKVEVRDLWERADIAVSYWIVLLSGTTHNEEREIGSTLLLWKAFGSKDAALIKCVQQSDRKEFICCSKHFGAVNCPSLFVSNSPDMASFLKFEPELLFRISKNPGELQRFLTRIHALIENGTPLSDIGKMLSTERFWSGLKLVYKEAKSLFSISLQAKTDL